LLAKAGKSYPEIAAVMNINEGTVKVNIAVLKAKLAAYHARNEKGKK
jgi:DNA-binding NarL/FixJ family response regulator